MQNLRALIRDPVHGVDPRDQVVDRPRTEQHAEVVVLAAGRVDVDELRLEHLLRAAEIGLCDLQLALVVAQVLLDAGELLVGEVVRLDRVLEVRVETLDLGEHALRLGLFRRDRAGGR